MTYVKDGNSHKNSFQLISKKPIQEIISLTLKIFQFIKDISIILQCVINYKYQIFKLFYHMQKKIKSNQKSSYEIERNYNRNNQICQFHNRKSLTPSICKSNHYSSKRKSQSKNIKQHIKRIERKMYSSCQKKSLKLSQKKIRQSKYQEPPFEKKKKSSDNNWKTKNRTNSTLANVRQSEYVELNHSKIKHQSKYDEQNMMDKLSHQHLNSPNKNKQLVYLFEKGKKYLKNSNYSKAVDYFKQILWLNPEQLDALYLIGICNFHLANYLESIKYFNYVLNKNENYKKNIYFLLSLSYKKINDINSSIQMLTIAIKKSPKYYDALIFRGKLYLKQKKYFQAIQDFNKCIKYQPQKVVAYNSKADCLRNLKKLTEAILCYTQSIIKNKQIDLSIFLKRAICYNQINKFVEAKADLDYIIKLDPYNSQAHLFKGLVYQKCKNYNDAILCFEQSIKHNSSQKAITKSIYEIAKIKIQLGDFYGASYTLERASSLDLDKKNLEKIKLFLDGSTLLMKKKIKKGVELLSILIKKYNINQYIKALAYSFRAYGYFCQYKYTHAVSDLIALQTQNYSLDQASFYNKLLLQGIIYCQNNKFQNALAKFSQVQNIKSNFSDVWIYKCLTYISIYNQNQSQSIEFRQKTLNSALQMISIAISKQQNNSNAYFLRAIINYNKKLLKQALQDIDNAINKSDDHVMKHFYLRAIISSAMGMNKQTINDLSNVISLIKDLKNSQLKIDDENPYQKQKQIAEAYLNRAKCYLILQEKKRAFQDLQSYISYKPLDPQIHILAGRLLFSIGAYQDAVKTYTHCPNIDKNNIILIQRIKCNLLLKQLNLCLKDMQKIIQNGDNKMMFDYGCLESLREASKGTKQNFQNALKKIMSVQKLIKQDGHIFQKADFEFYKGLYNFYLRNFEQSLQNFENSLDLKRKSNCIESLAINQQSRSSETIDDDFLNKIYTETQIKYNIGIIYLLKGDKHQAFQILKNYPSFKQLIQNQQSNEFLQIQSNNQQAIQITPFPVNNRLCSIFPLISFGNKTIWKFRFSFCLPKVILPDIQLKIEQNLIENLTMNSTQPRPDAPWIKRNDFGVVFTQQVIGYDIDMNTENELSERKQERSNNLSIEDDQRMQHSIQNGYLDSYQAQKTQKTEKWQKNRIKNLLLLDPQTEAKLMKLIKK